MGQIMFKNMETGETKDYEGVKDFTPYKEEAPYDLHTASEVCIDILKGVIKKHSFDDAITSILLENGLMHRDFKHGKWQYVFTYSFKRKSTQKDLVYPVAIIFNDDKTISEVALDDSRLPAFNKDVKEAICNDFVTRYKYSRVPKMIYRDGTDTVIAKVTTYCDTDTVIAKVTNYSKEKFMNRDEFQKNVRKAIYDAVRKYVIVDIFDLHKDSYVNRRDYLDEVNERFTCDTVSIRWHTTPLGDIMEYYGTFKVRFSYQRAPMHFVVRCGIDQRDTTDIFNSLVVTLRDNAGRDTREHHSQMLEKEISKAVEAAVPHTYVEPKMAWPTVNPNIVQLTAYELISKSLYDISKDCEEEKKMTEEKAKDIYSKLDLEQREAVKTIGDAYCKDLLKEIGDLKADLALVHAAIKDANNENEKLKKELENWKEKNRETEHDLSVFKMNNQNLIDDNRKLKYLVNSAYGVATVEHNKFEIKEIVINEPAMIIFWKDGTKTIVKAQEGEAFDEEKGLAMAYAKKALGNNYAAGGKFKQRLKHAKRPKEKEETDISKLPICKEIMEEAMRRVKMEMEADAAKETAEKPAAKKPATKRAKK